MHIAFTNLPEMRLEDYDNINEYYKPTKIAFDNLIKELRQCTSVFIDKADDLSIHNSVKGNINSELNYFHYKVATEREIHPSPFEMKVSQTAGSYNLTSPNFREFIRHQHPEIFESVLFIEFDPRMLTMRAGVLPHDKVNPNSDPFFELGIVYQYIQHEEGQPTNHNSVGIFNDILNHLYKTSSKLNIYRSYKFFIEEDKGGFFLLLENLDKRRKDTVRYAKLLAEDLEQNTFDSGISIDRVISSHVNSEKVKYRLRSGTEKRAKYHRDLFISLSAKDEKHPFVEKLVRCLEDDYKLIVSIFTQSIVIGEHIDNTLREELIKSREMCVIISDESIKSNYVMTEWGAAWFLKKNITPIFMTDIDPKSLDNRLVADKGFFIDSDESLHKFAMALKLRKDVEEIIEFDSIASVY